MGRTKTHTKNETHTHTNTKGKTENTIKFGEKRQKYSRKQQVNPYPSSRAVGARLHVIADLGRDRVPRVRLGDAHLIEKEKIKNREKKSKFDQEKFESDATINTREGERMTEQRADR